MRYRVKHRASLFADEVKPEYYDGWCVYCESCKAPGNFVFHERSDALNTAREANRSVNYSEHVFEVIPVVGNCPILEATQARIVWLPQIDGMATKHVITVEQFDRMFARVEE